MTNISEILSYIIHCKRSYFDKVAESPVSVLRAIFAEGVVIV